MDNNLKQFATDLATQSTTHKQWLAIVRFGLTQLLEDQPYFIGLITDETEP